MKKWAKRAGIILILIGLCGSLYLNFKLKPYYDSAMQIQQTKVKPGQYYQNNDKSKKVIVHDNIVNVNGQNFYMVQSVDGDKNVVTLQNMKTNESFVYKIARIDNKYVFRTIEKGAVGKIAITWNR